MIAEGFSLVAESGGLLSSCGAYLLQRTWDLPRHGIKPKFPALAGRFLTTGPPGKSLQIPYVVITEACPKDLSKDEEIELSW